VAGRELLATITDVRLRIRELVEQLPDRDVRVLKHGHPVAVMLCHHKYETLLTYIEELEVRLSAYEAGAAPGHMPIPWEKVGIEGGFLT
jgi:PHD/YefM family antitoxin component YafN of YafNO toxin-antitoxin module